MKHDLTILRYWPVLIPVIWCVIVCWMMHPESIASDPKVNVDLKWLMYDETDLTAFAIRGANSINGRLPGRENDAPYREMDEFIHAFDGPQQPLSDRFFLEYPLPTLIYFRMGYLFHKAPTLPSAVADGHQYPIGQHIPRNEDEWVIWSSFRSAARFYLISSTAALCVMILVLGYGYFPNEKWNGMVWLMVLPGAVYFSLCRFDIFPALMTAGCFWALGRQKIYWAAGFLGFGILIKLYPILFVPIIFRYLGIRNGIHFLLGLGLTVSLGFGIALLLTDWQSLIGPIRVQLNRSLEDGWTLYGKLFPMWLGNHGWARLSILSVVIALCLIRTPQNIEDVLARCGIILSTFVVLAVFWSPQWLIWFLPILVPLARKSYVFLFFTIAIDLMNYFSFPVLLWLWCDHWPKDVTDILEVVFTLVRGFTWIALAVCLSIVKSKNGRFSLKQTLPTLCNEILHSGNQKGIPRGLRWVSCEQAGEPLFENKTSDLAFVPFNISFEPIPDSDMEGIPAARMPRPVTVIFRFINGKWNIDRPPIFNLSPSQVMKRLEMNSNSRSGISE